MRPAENPGITRQLSAFPSQRRGIIAWGLMVPSTPEILRQDSGHKLLWWESNPHILFEVVKAREALPQCYRAYQHANAHYVSQLPTQTRVRLSAVWS